MSKQFPGVIALDRVDFEVAAGEIVGLVGENGAGKSTLVKILTGIHRADSGTIAIDGEPVLFVRDNGVGFEQAYVARLFAPFQRLHTERDFPGSRIGLAIVHRIVRRARAQHWPH